MANSYQGLQPNVFYTIAEADIPKFVEGIINEYLSKTQEAEDNNSPAGLLTKKEVMERLHVTAMTLHRWDKSGYLPMKHVGRKVFYSGTDIERVLKNK